MQLHIARCNVPLCNKFLLHCAFHSTQVLCLQFVWFFLVHWGKYGQCFFCQHLGWRHKNLVNRKKKKTREFFIKSNNPFIEHSWDECIDRFQPNFVLTLPATWDIFYAYPVFSSFLLQSFFIIFYYHHLFLFFSVWNFWQMHFYSSWFMRSHQNLWCSYLSIYSYHWFLSLFVKLCFTVIPVTFVKNLCFPLLAHCFVVKGSCLNVAQDPWRTWLESWLLLDIFWTLVPLNTYPKLHLCSDKDFFFLLLKYMKIYVKFAGFLE